MRRDGRGEGLAAQRRALNGETFRGRVEALRDAWAERRQLKQLAGAHDFASQLVLLRTIHGWADAACREIRAVYGTELPIAVSPPPCESSPSFAVSIGGGWMAAFAVAERGRPRAAGWAVSVTVDSRGATLNAGPQRRFGQWTRGQLEDLLLTVLGAYERAQSRDQGAGSEGPPPA